MISTNLVKNPKVLDNLYFEEPNAIKIPYEIVGRRCGDIASCYADVSKAEKELRWKAKRDISDMCRDAWKFEQNYKSEVE